MASVKENLIAARALIDTPEKWAQGEDLAQGGLCAALACSAVSHGPTNDFDAMRSALIGVMPGSSHSGPMKLVNFNDHPDTTHADVMALFDRAIAAAEAQP